MAGRREAVGVGAIGFRAAPPRERDQAVCEQHARRHIVEHRERILKERPQPIAKPGVREYAALSHMGQDRSLSGGHPETRRWRSPLCFPIRKLRPPKSVEACDEPERAMVGALGLEPRTR